MGEKNNLGCKFDQSCLTEHYTSTLNLKSQTRISATCFRYISYQSAKMCAAVGLCHKFRIIIKNKY